MTNKIYKAEIVKVNLSETFMARGRCRGCGEMPSIYYYVKNPLLWHDPSKVKDIFAFIRKYVNRMCNDFYLMESPGEFHHVNYFGFQVSFKGYNPKLHKTRTPWIYYKQETEITEFLTCECGQSTWAFSEKTVRYRPEIILRKARYKYPQKFEF